MSTTNHDKHLNCQSALHPHPLTVELCCGGMEDVRLAADFGIPRIELNCGMAVGGLTPSPALAMRARKEYSGQIICMVRPREGGFCYSMHEYLQMLDDSEWLLSLNTEGIATGFLTQEGEIDLQRCRKLRALFPKAVLVFHKAFDVTPDLPKAMEQLIDCGFDRILTSGGQTSAIAGAQMIQRLVLESKGRIGILPGGGIRAANVASLVSLTGCSEVHSAVREQCSDSSTRHNDRIEFGLPGRPNGEYGRTSTEQLSALLDAVACR